MQITPSVAVPVGCCTKGDIWELGGVHQRGWECEVFPRRNSVCHHLPRTDCHFASDWDTVVKDCFTSLHMPNGHFQVWGNVSSSLRKWILIHLKYFLTNSKQAYQNNRMNHWRSVPSRQENAYNSCWSDSFFRGSPRIHVSLKSIPKVF